MLGRILGKYLDKTAASYLRAAKAYVSSRDFPRDNFSWSPLSKHRNQALKRRIDIGVGAIGTAALVPLSLILAPLIKIDSPGPVFYTQEREGKNSEQIKIYKFRTMRLDADQEAIAPTTMEATYALRFQGDPRVSRIGKFLRLYGIDEIPQFWSILTGDMTLLGLRAWIKPELDALSDKDNINWRHHRQQIRSSLAAAPFCFLCKHVTKPEEFIALEMYYLGNWSLRGDIKLMARGLVALLAGKHF